MNTTPIEFKAVMQRQHDKAIYLSNGYTTDTGFLSYLFDFEEQRWDYFIEQITCEENFILQFPDDDEYLNGWSHIANMQLTALRSINDEPIYNHQIVKDEEDVLYVVDMFNYYDMNVLKNHNLEIVGNRFQSPELLELCK